MSEPVRFYFDYISPYAYVAWTQIHTIAARHGRTVAPIPVLFAALLNHHGQKGPAEIPAKRIYTFKDAYRKAHRYGLPPLEAPPSHPFNPLLALRVSTLPLDLEVQRRIIDAFYAATWAGGGGVETPEAVSRILSGLGLDAPALLEQAESLPNKAALRAQTEAAIKEQVFGVPTMIADGELFWGVDALPSLEDRLLGQDPVPPGVGERWRHLPATASRL
jgi:2-hydroxychromene-2-carboxylate isomerase